MSTYAHTSDYLGHVDAAHDEHARYVPAFLMFGVEHDVATEDEIVTEEMIAEHDLVASIAYAVRMAL